MNKWITRGIFLLATALLLLTSSLIQTRPGQKSPKVRDKEVKISVERLSVPIQADTLRTYLLQYYGKRYPSLQVEPGETAWQVSWNRGAQILMNKMGGGYGIERQAFVDAGLLKDTDSKTVLTLPVVREGKGLYLSTPVLILNDLLHKVIQRE